MSATWRQRALFGALGATLLLALTLAFDQEESAEPAAAALARTTKPSTEPAQTGLQIELSRLQRADVPAQDGDKEGPNANAFAATSWYVAPPPPPPKPKAKPLPPPPPSAPPMPFSFLGRYEEAGVRTILLVKGERIYTVAEGDVIENTYRVERLAGGLLELTYLPLGIKQTIPAGGT